MKLYTRIILLMALLTMSREGQAKIKLPQLFNDGMVLQRDQKIPIWGWADPAEQVKITFNHKTYTTVAGKDSTWSVSMMAIKAGGPYTMTVSGIKHIITIKDILMGDVWVCSGQSNMEFTLSRSKALYQNEIANSTNANIRHFYVKKVVGDTPLADLTSPGWRSANPKTAPSFSAVAYFFAKAMYEKYQVPIGLIHASWGGTPIQAWMNKESLKEFPEKKKRAEFLEANYKKIKAAELKKLPIAKPTPFQAYPTALFNGMIAPLTAYGIKGVLWYQGETDTKRSFEYQKLFPAMIKGWRSQWKQAKLPFLYVQLPNYGPVSTSPSESYWAELREAQAMALSLPETGMAITHDIGEKGNIHPLNKADVGKRLALVAQHVVYGESIVYSGPLYKTMQIKGNKVIISFSNLGGGLQVKDGKNLKNFAIAAADRKFVWAKAKIKGNKIVVWSDDVNMPVAVRYAWADSPVGINLYNKEGLPAACFRTDNWQQVICPIIPFPNASESTGKIFRLDNKTTILVNNKALLPLAYYLQTELLSKHGLTVIVQKKSQAPTIILEMSAKNTDKPEAYQLKMDESHIKLIAGNTNGIFNGIVSLLQLTGVAAIKHNAFELACWNISDAPKYAWRGLMLDESRHFFGKDKVKSILDWMAFYKLNKFHWHLTDMPAWRLEIKRYPKLTTVGGIGSFSDANAPAQYYTQKDIVEIVAYAKERFITVIPEVDMPGHASAANRAYPEFNGGGTEKLPDFTFNPGKESTYQYLSHILKETAVLFPAGIIHLGADEVNYGNRAWETDVNVQQLQQTHKLADRKAVEQYFIRRMADSVIKLNRKVLVWDEAADAGLDPKETVVFWWRQDKPEQLKLALDKGMPVVLCPRLPLYFDFVQDSIHRIGRKGKKGEYNGLTDVYHFSPEQIPVIGDKGKLIKGIQADIWTESISSNRRLDFMLFPRIAALAEAAWTDTKQKNYEQFKQKLKKHLQLYRAAGIYYYDPFSPLKNSEPDHMNKNNSTGYID